MSRGLIVGRRRHVVARQRQQRHGVLSTRGQADGSGARSGLRKTCVQAHIHVQPACATWTRSAPFVSQGGHTKRCASSASVGACCHRNRLVQRQHSTAGAGVPGMFLREDGMQSDEKQPG